MPQAFKRIKCKLKLGDVLELHLPDGRFGYALVVDHGILTSGGSPYLAVFQSAYMSRPALDELAKDTVALAGWTTDTLFREGKWQLCADGYPIPVIPLPNFKVRQGGTVYVTDFRGTFVGVAEPAEAEMLDDQFSFTAQLFNDAIEALHGLGQWKEGYDKLTIAYAQGKAVRKVSSRYDVR